MATSSESDQSTFEYVKLDLKMDDGDIHEYVLETNTSVFAFVSDATVRDITALTKALYQQRAASKLFVLAGGHGYPDGNNWDADGGFKNPIRGSYEYILQQVQSFVNEEDE